jgi:hypothetical protein
MRRPTIHRVGSVFIAVLLAAAPAVAAAQTQAPVLTELEAQRTRLFQDGVGFAQAGRWPEAAEKFRAVVAIRSAPRALFTLAEAEEKSGRFATAKKAYLRALAEARTAGAADVEHAAADALRAIEPRVPRLLLQLPLDVAGAEVSVDGQAVNVNEWGIEVDPGTHRVTARAPGRKAFATTSTVAAGARETLALPLELVDGPATTVAGAPAPPPLAPTGDRPWRMPPSSALVAGGVGLGFGIAGGIVYFTGKSRHDAACPERICASTDDEERGNDARSAMMVGDVLMIAGGAGLAAGVVLWVVSPRQAARSEATALTMSPLHHGATLRWKAAF